MLAQEELHCTAIEEACHDWQDGHEGPRRSFDLTYINREQKGEKSDDKVCLACLATISLPFQKTADRLAAPYATLLVRTEESVAGRDGGYCRVDVMRRSPALSRTAARSRFVCASLVSRDTALFYSHFALSSRRICSQRRPSPAIAL